MVFAVIGGLVFLTFVGVVIAVSNRSEPKRLPPARPKAGGSKQSRYHGPAVGRSGGTTNPTGTSTAPVDDGGPGIGHVAFYAAMSDPGPSSHTDHGHNHTHYTPEAPSSSYGGDIGSVDSSTSYGGGDSGGSSSCGGGSSSCGGGGGD